MGYHAYTKNIIPMQAIFYTQKKQKPSKIQKNMNTHTHKYYIIENS